MCDCEEGDINDDGSGGDELYTCREEGSIATKGSSMSVRAARAADLKERLLLSARPI